MKLVEALFAPTTYKYGRFVVIPPRVTKIPRDNGPKFYKGQAIGFINTRVYFLVITCIISHILTIIRHHPCISPSCSESKHAAETKSGTHIRTDVVRGNTQEGAQRTTFAI